MPASSLVAVKWLMAPATMWLALTFVETGCSGSTEPATSVPATSEVVASCTTTFGSPPVLTGEHAVCLAFESGLQDSAFAVYGRRLDELWQVRSVETCEFGEVSGEQVLISVANGMVVSTSNYETSTNEACEFQDPNKCSDDQREPNDSVSTAMEIEQGWFLVHAESDDYWSIPDDIGQLEVQWPDHKEIEFSITGSAASVVNIDAKGGRASIPTANFIGSVMRVQSQECVNYSLRWTQ